MCWITTPSAPPKLPLVHVAYAGSEFRPEAFNNLFLASLSTSNFRSMTATCSVFTALFPLLYLPCDGDQNLIKSWLEDHPQLSILTNPPDSSSTSPRWPLNTQLWWYQPPSYKTWDGFMLSTGSSLRVWKGAQSLISRFAPRISCSSLFPDTMFCTCAHPIPPK